MMTSEMAWRFDARAVERRGNRDLAEFMRRQACQCAVEGADRRARGADDDDVVPHNKTPCMARPFDSTPHLARISSGYS